MARSPQNKADKDTRMYAPACRQAGIETLPEMGVFYVLQTFYIKTHGLILLFVQMEG